MRILFLAPWYPYPPNNGSKLRIYNLLRGLARHHEVTLLSFTDTADADVTSPAIRRLCDVAGIVQRKPYRPESWRARFGFFSLTPRAVVDTFSPEMADLIRQTIATREFDLVLASESKMAAYAPHFGTVPAVFEDVELGTLYNQFADTSVLRNRLRYGLTWLKHSYYLRRLLRHFGACTVVSEQERELLTQAVNGYQPVEIVPNCVDVPSYSDVQVAPQPNSLIFTGSLTYSANHDAMAWFLEDIYPLVQDSVPDVHLTITGDHADLPLPAARNLTLTGFVDDVRPLIASSWISLAPIRVGAGTRLKILEAMALRTPVVSTTKGAEGLDVQHNEHLLIADTPSAHADAIVRLLNDSELRQRLTENAYTVVHEQYDWGAVMPRFLDLVEHVAGVDTPRSNGRA